MKNALMLRCLSAQTDKTGLRRLGREGRMGESVLASCISFAFCFSPRDTHNKLTETIMN